MKKQILATLLIATISIASIFAYTAPSVILTADKAPVDYSFKIQMLDDNNANASDFTGDATTNVVLDATGGTTNAFTVATTANGNLHDAITFSVEVATGEFLDTTDSTIGTNWYPVIEEMAASATEANPRDEVVSYEDGTAGAFTSSTTGTFSTTFTRGKHLINTEVARFKLQYKADDELVAGSYKSTTTVDITTEG
jgi:hypothetical protein